MVVIVELPTALIQQMLYSAHGGLSMSVGLRVVRRAWDKLDALPFTKLLELSPELGTIVRPNGLRCESVVSESVLHLAGYCLCIQSPELIHPWKAAIAITGDEKVLTCCFPQICTEHLEGVFRDCLLQRLLGLRC